MIFISQQDIPDHSAGRHGGAGVAEMPFGFLTLTALEGQGHCALDRAAAPLAEGRLNETNIRLARRADIPFLGDRPRLAAHLTNLRIGQTQRGIKPGF
jgi:hypothetical protein